MNNREDDKSKIDALQERLDSRSFSPNPNKGRDIFIKEEEEFSGDWSQTETRDTPFFSQNSLENKMLKKRSSFLKLFLTGSIVFFVLALAIAFFIIFRGSNIISSQNVEISVSGPVSVSGGEILSLDITILNKNNTSLELADLIMEYPEGTRSAKNLSTDLPRERFSLGNIKSNSKINKKVEAILFGEEGTHEKIKITVEYRVAGSNAIFFTEKEHEVELSSSPVSFNIESLTDVNSGKEITVEITLKSNSNNTIEDLMFVSEFPFGFTFKESSPKPSFEQNIWKIGDLSPGDERKIKITGVLEGQDGEERVFHFFGGIQSGDNEEELQTAFVSVSRSIFIKKPFLALDLLIDGSTSESYSANVSKIINVDVNWKNNLPTNVANLQIEAKLSGDFNESSVFVDKGFYNSVNNTVTWSTQGNPAFESISPGQSGTVGLKFTATDVTEKSITNPEVSISVSVKGRRLSENDVSEEINSAATRNIRFNTNLSISPRVVHSSGQIVNSGPIPPKAETETTYAVIWTLSNNINNVSDIVVYAKLPQYVRWIGNFVPIGEELSYNASSREVSWNVNSLGSGASGAKEVSFQLGFLPSISQVGLAPVLIDKVRMVGKDDFTGVMIESTKGELTTKTSTDPNYKLGDDKVVN